MGLTGAFNIGRTALAASQFGLQVTGNNMANAATPGFSRQTLRMQPAGGLQAGGSILGRGVQVSGIRREISEAVQSRLRLGISDQAAGRARLDVFVSVEATLAELSGSGLSDTINDFFSGWSERANLVGSNAVVIQQGEQLATHLEQLRERLVDQQGQIDGQLGAMVVRANAVLDELAQINESIVTAEQGRLEAGNLRDRRDSLLGELSELMDVSTIELAGGGIDVLVGSTPVLLGGQSRGLELVRETVGDRIEVSVAVKQNGRMLPVRSGQIGGLLETREVAVEGTIAELDRIAAELIFQVNGLHATGTNEEGLTVATSLASFTPGDRTLALNDPTSGSLGSLPVLPSNGGFVVRVTDTSTGSVTVKRIDIDLDGLDASGAAGFGDDTSIEDIRAALNAIPGINATFDSNGSLRLDADPGSEFSFEDDSSGVLASLGVNAFFTGSDARDIRVRQDLVATPSLLRVGRIVDGTYVENGTALAIVEMQDTSLDALGGESVRSRWSIAVQTVANRTSNAINQAESATLVREGLEAQRASLSGVSLDEEAINLLQFQKQFEGAARLIAVAQEMLDTLMAIV